jgi:NADH dehydrogenase/NADH:ubiquinone oxidoreductase subunit G
VIVVANVLYKIKLWHLVQVNQDSKKKKDIGKNQSKFLIMYLLDRERCIQCSRCTRFADDVAGDPLITFVNRGDTTEVNTFPDDEFASYFSGNIVQICPVGALTAKPYRFSYSTMGFRI